MHTRNVALSGLLCLGVALLGGAAYLGARYRAARDGAAWPEAAARQALPLFLQDRQVLASSGVFPLSSSRSADAGALLNPRLPLDGPAGQVQAHNSHLQGAPDLRLPDDVLAALGRFNWPAYQPDWQRLDTGWFALLARYDHWRPLTAPPGVADTEPRTPPVRLLLAWSKLRLLDGARRGDVPAASREVRKLAQLLWTQADLVSAVAALAVLRHETTFIAALNARGLAASTAGVTPLSSEQHARARRYLMAYPDYLDFRVPPDLRDQALAGDSAQLGYCPAFAEARRRDLMVRPFLRRAHAAQFAAVRAQAERARQLCGDSPLLTAVADPEYVVPALLRDDAFALAGAADQHPAPGALSTSTLLRLPILRETVGYVLLGIVSPAGISSYAQPLKVTPR